MTIQEKIMEGADQLLNSFNGEGDFMTELFDYLHSRGVVIMVKKGLPSAFNINDDVISAVEYKKKLDGCGFFEPLIEEK